MAISEVTVVSDRRFLALCYVEGLGVAGFSAGLTSVPGVPVVLRSGRGLGGRAWRQEAGTLMDSRVLTIVAVTASLVSGSAVVSTGAVAASLASNVWGAAKEVPGTAALNQGGSAGITSVSCAAAGNCTAGGFYLDSSARSQAFVVSQVNGAWQAAKEVPGTAALNQGGNARVDAVSCAAAGSCTAGGFYEDSSQRMQAFVVSLANGAWSAAKEVPGTAALNQGEGATTTSVSCGSAGNCTAGGSYTDSSHHVQAFVVSQINGAWHAAKEVPGTAALNQGGNAGISSVSCATAADCSAGGSYLDSSDHRQTFVVNQVNGAWGAAKEVPGTAALNQGGDAGISSLSCATAGKCSAGGSYTDSSQHIQVFVVSET